MSLPNGAPTSPRRGELFPLRPAMEACKDALTLLSGREREILYGAVEGQTDEQIAQSLGITTSTVNSYWVRIRGKVGPFSRTEIVGVVLRNEAQRLCAELIAENALLVEEAERTANELAQTQVELRAMRESSWHLEALSHAPEAILVCTLPGLVNYANQEAHRLFAAGPGTLEGLPLKSLLTSPAAEVPSAFGELFASPPSTRVLFGFEQPWCVCRLDGSTFRGVLTAERFGESEPSMVVFTVRQFGAEVEALLAMVRKPLAYVREPKPSAE